MNIAKKLLSLKALSHSLDVPQKLLLYPVADAYVQLNLSTTATLGAEESGHCKEVAVVERFQTRVNV